MEHDELSLRRAYVSRYPLWSGKVVRLSARIRSGWTVPHALMAILLRVHCKEKVRVCQNRRTRQEAEAGDRT